MGWSEKKVGNHCYKPFKVHLALWEVLRIYCVGGKLLSAIKLFYEEASACVKINEKTSEHFEIKVGLRQVSYLSFMLEVCLRATCA